MNMNAPTPRQYAMPPYCNQPQLIPQQPHHGMYLTPFTATAPTAQSRYVDTAVPMPTMGVQQQMAAPHFLPHNNAAPMLPHHPTPLGQEKLLATMTELLSVAHVQRGLLEKLVVALAADKIGKQVQGPIKNGNARRYRRQVRPPVGTGGPFPLGANPGGVTGFNRSRFQRQQGGGGSRFQESKGPAGPIGVVQNPVLSRPLTITVPAPPAGGGASTSAAASI